MRKILEYLRLVLFVGGVLIGIQIPSFVDQYGKRLDAHWQESEISLKEFKRDAEKYFSGDLQQLINQYQNNADPIVNDGGRNIAKLHERNQLLSDARARFSHNQLSPYLQTLFEPLDDIREETWADYSFTVVLNTFAIIGGLATGVLLTALVEFFLALLGLIFIRPLIPKRNRHGRRF